MTNGAKRIKEVSRVVGVAPTRWAAPLRIRTTEFGLGERRSGSSQNTQAVSEQYDDTMGTLPHE